MTPLYRTVKKGASFASSRNNSCLTLLCSTSFSTPIPCISSFSGKSHASVHCLILLGQPRQSPVYTSCRIECLHRSSVEIHEASEVPSHVCESRPCTDGQGGGLKQLSVGSIEVQQSIESCSSKVSSDDAVRSSVGSSA